jgi:starvation-inducible outer membrane lipoprotein
MKTLLVLFLLVLAAGCATVPDEVKNALEGNEESLRLIKKDLVQTMPDGDAKALWTARLNAFIVRARASVAWADDADDFDAAAAMEEEKAKVER